LGNDDHAFSFDWKEGAQYWFDIVHDSARDRMDLTRQIHMIDPNNRVETFVIHGAAQPNDIVPLWAKVIGCPADFRITCRTNGNQNHLWGIVFPRSAVPIAATVRTPTGQTSVGIIDGSDTYRACQLSRALGIKLPPFSRLRISPSTTGGILFEADEEFSPLNLGIIRELQPSWQMPRLRIDSPGPMEWWEPANREEIMRLGHSINFDIPEDLSLAVFSPEPWGKHFTIHIVHPPELTPSPPPSPTGDGEPPFVLVCGPIAGWFTSARLATELGEC
jgi:hypothetical protein